MGVKGCQGEDKSGQGSSSEIPTSTFLHPGSETQPLRSVGSGDGPVGQPAPALVTLTVRSLRISGDFLAICSPMQWHGNKAPDCSGHSPGSVPYFIGVYLFNLPMPLFSSLNIRTYFRRLLQVHKFKYGEYHYSPKFPPSFLLLSAFWPLLTVPLQLRADNLAFRMQLDQTHRHIGLQATGRKKGLS